MAANYWTSTQRKFWTFSKDTIVEIREDLERENPDLVRMFPLPESSHLNVYFNQQINRLGKRLSVRQQAIATAQMYMKRFYMKIEIRRTNPYLVMATALYLALKTEECPQHIRMITTEARSLWPDIVSLDTHKIGECEFFLISEMNSQLIIHQPYRTLTQVHAEFSLTPEEVALAHAFINDHYMTDLPLVHAPHIIAYTSIMLCLVLPSAAAGGSAAAVAESVMLQMQARREFHGGSLASRGGDRPTAPDARGNKLSHFAAFIADSEIDVYNMADCVQEFISLQQVKEQYNDKTTRDQIHRFIRARGLDKQP